MRHNKLILRGVLVIAMVLIIAVAVVGCAAAKEDEQRALAISNTLSPENAASVVNLENPRFRGYSLYEAYENFDLTGSGEGDKVSVYYRQAGALVGELPYEKVLYVQFAGGGEAEFITEAQSRHKFEVLIAVLRASFTADENDPVGSGDGCRAVGDDDCRAVFHKAGDGVLHQKL